MFMVFPRSAVAHCTQSLQPHTALRADKDTVMGQALAFFDVEERLCISLGPQLITQSAEQCFKTAP